MHRLQHCCVTLVSSKFLPPQSFPPHSTPSSRFAPPQTNAPYPSCTPSLNTSQFPHNLYPAGVPFPPDTGHEIMPFCNDGHGIMGLSAVRTFTQWCRVVVETPGRTSLPRLRHSKFPHPNHCISPVLLENIRPGSFGMQDWSLTASLPIFSPARSTVYIDSVQRATCQTGICFLARQLFTSRF